MFNGGNRKMLKPFKGIKDPHLLGNMKAEENLQTEAKLVNIHKDVD